MRTEAPQDLPAMKLTLNKYFDQVYDQKQLLKVVDSLKSRWRAVCMLEGDKVQRMKSPERRALGPIQEELLPSSDSEENDEVQADHERSNRFKSNLATADPNDIGSLSQEMNKNLSGRVKSIQD